MPKNWLKLACCCSLSFIPACDDPSALTAADDDSIAADDDAGPPAAELNGPAALAQDDVIGFDDYKRLHAVHGPDGDWIVEGDIRMRDEAEVRAWYDRTVLGLGAACDDPERCPRSTVMHFDGADSVWSAHEKLALTYCIADMGSATANDRVRDALAGAARDWELSADVNFIHLSAQDGSSCAPGSNGVMFRVRRPASCENNLIARAFFPHYASADREVLFCNLAFSGSDAELLSTTKHELGHILGLRHEHVRWSQTDDDCTESSSWRGVTGADQASIMGYDFCAGIINNNDVLTGTDRVGVQRLYTIPKGHGRLSGNAFHQRNSFLGTGVGDDLFWYVPQGAQYHVWSSPTSSSASVSFTQQSTNQAMDRGWKPLAVQWVSNGDANYNREVLFFGPGGYADKLFTNLNNGTFSTTNFTIGGWWLPVIGRFHGGSNSEILWWGPGDGSLLWRYASGTGVTQTVADTEYFGSTVDLDFGPKLLTGSFSAGASGNTEILAYGDCYGYVTRGTGTTGFETDLVDMLYIFGTCDMSGHIPLLGDFDGDSQGDIFWYGPGAAPDRMLRVTSGTLWTMSDFAGYQVFDLPVAGYYKPLVGDFNGDGKSDIFWYQPGTNPDPIWLFQTASTYTSLMTEVDGDYAPIVGDFNSDSCDDIVWYSAVTDQLLIWRSDCDGTFTAQTSLSVPANAYPVGYGIGL